MRQQDVRCNKYFAFLRLFPYACDLPVSGSERGAANVHGNGSFDPEAEFPNRLKRRAMMAARFGTESAFPLVRVRVSKERVDAEPAV
jgi:hypothetical protein